jgi:predicted negative regulator of RcsB-dependent stress response
MINYNQRSNDDPEFVRQFRRDIIMLLVLSLCSVLGLGSLAAWKYYKYKGKDQQIIEHIEKIK